MKKEIVVLERIHEDGLKIISKFAKLKFLLGTKRNNYLNKISTCFGVIIKSATLIDKDFLDKAKNLKVVLRAGTGLDNIDLDLLKKKKIKLINVPHANSVSAAEFTVMQILFLCRRLPEIYPKLINKDYRRHLFEGYELKNLSVGIVGMGNIGYEVAKRLKPFGCKMYSFDKNSKNKKEFIELGGKFLDSIESLMSKVNILTLHCNLNNSNRNLIGDKEFNKIKKNLLLVNCARAELIDNKALIKAIKKGKVLAAAIDVISPEPNYDKLHQNKSHIFLKEKKIFYTPHIAASTNDAQLKIAVHLANQLKNFLNKH